MTRQWMEFNTNQYIAVRLTEQGIQFLREEHQAFWEDVKRRGAVPAGYPIPHFRPPSQDAEGLHLFQGWDFMYKFGPLMRMGVDLGHYFQDGTTIRIEVQP